MLRTLAPNPNMSQDYTIAGGGSALAQSAAWNNGWKRKGADSGRRISNQRPSRYPRTRIPYAM
jgi:hypothetical protein